MERDKFLEIRDQYPVLEKYVYLDTATSGLLPRRSYERFGEALKYRFENGMDIDEYFEHWDQVDRTRRTIARMLNALEREIVFGISSSALFNLFANGIELSGGCNMVSYDTAYPSMTYTWLNKKDQGIELRLAEAVDGRVDCEQLIGLIDDNTVAVNVCHVDMSTGYRHDLERLGEFCRSRGIWLCVDATQSAGAMNIDVQQMKIDFLTASSYKWLQNILGVGFAYIRGELLDKLTQSVMGWANTKSRIHEDPTQYIISDSASKFENGGQCFLGIESLNIVISQYLELGKKDVEQHICNLSNHLYEQVETLPDVTVFGGYSQEHRSNIVCLNIPEKWGITNAYLRNYGIRVNMLSPDKMRVSLHYYNSVEDIDRLADFLKSC